MIFFFLLLDFGTGGSQARLCQLESEGGKCTVWESQTLEKVECLQRIVFEQIPLFFLMLCKAV